MGFFSSPMSIIAFVILVALTVVSLYVGYKRGFFGSFTSGNNQTLQQTITPLNETQQNGGKRNKKSKSLKSKSKSTTMTTTGVYLLLGAVLVGYIMSYF